MIIRIAYATEEPSRRPAAILAASGRPFREVAAPHTIDVVSGLHPVVASVWSYEDADGEEIHAVEVETFSPPDAQVWTVWHTAGGCPDDNTIIRLIGADPKKGDRIMTPAEFKAARHALGLSAEGCAKLLLVQSGRTVRRWEAGDSDVPGPVQVLMTALVDSAEVRRYFGLQLRED